MYVADHMPDCNGTLGGAICAYQIEPDSGKLTYLNRRPSRGQTACYIAVSADGKFVLTAPAPDVQALFEAPGRRYTDEQLAGLAAQPDPAQRRGRRRGGRWGRGFADRRMAFFVEEGVAALIQPGDLGDLVLTCSSTSSRNRLGANGTGFSQVRS